MANNTDNIVLLGVTNNQGYAPDQVDSGVTLGELLAAVKEAIMKYGEDAIVVTKDSGNRYGANYGRFARGSWGEQDVSFFKPSCVDCDEEQCVCDDEAEVFA